MNLKHHVQFYCFCKQKEMQISYETVTYNKTEMEIHKQVLITATIPRKND